MRIRLLPSVAIALEAMAVQAGKLEFSGLGTCHREDDTLVIDDVHLMHVGSEGYTEISPESIYEYKTKVEAEGREIRVWFHRHPVGGAIPGPGCWSGMDNNTIATTPLGGIPELVKWSISIVRTPMGWVGRVDNHLKKLTWHVEVEGQAPLEVRNLAADLTRRFLDKSSWRGTAYNPAEPWYWERSRYQKPAARHPAKTYLVDEKTGELIRPKVEEDEGIEQLSVIIAELVVDEWLADEVPAYFKGVFEDTSIEEFLKEVEYSNDDRLMRRDTLIEAGLVELTDLPDEMKDAVVKKTSELERWRDYVRLMASEYSTPKQLSFDDLERVAHGQNKNPRYL